MRFAAEIWLWGLLFSLFIGLLFVLAGLRWRSAQKQWGHEQQVLSLLTGRSALRRTVGAALVSLASACAFLAAAQPQYGQGTRILPATNLDVVLVLDYSKSMYARDVSPSRIERAKIEVSRLVQKLAGARLGAVAFAGESIAFPLTSDGAAIAQFFRGLQPNDMPVGGTAIASALHTGRELFQRDPLSAQHEKVLLLVTDGEDLEGDPIGAARQAADAGIRVEVVQIGGRSPEPIPEVDENGLVVGLRKDRSGQVLTTSLSPEGERQLAEVAQVGGGTYHAAERGEVGIDAIAQSLRTLMTEQLSERVETVYADIYHYPLLAAIFLLLLETFLGSAARRTWTPEPPRQRRARRTPSRLRSAAVLLALCGLGCEPFDALFERESPTVREAIQALENKETEAAIQLLTDYLETGACEEGVIGAGERARSLGDAALDLALAFAQAQDAQAKSAQPGLGLDPSGAGAAEHSAIECALRLLGPLAENESTPVELRARSHYLMGNLEMRREQFRAAVTAYERGLQFTPAETQDEEGDPLGRDLAFNRALALRRALAKEEEEKQNQSNTDDSPESDSEEKSEEGEQDKSNSQEESDDKQNEDSSGDSDEDKPSDDKNSQDPGENEDEQKQDSSQNGDSPEQQEQGSSDTKDSQEDSSSAQDPESQDPAASAAQTNPDSSPSGPSVSQDERQLDLLEQAPTLQQHEAKKHAARGGRRSTMEDK